MANIAVMPQHYRRSSATHLESLERQLAAEKRRIAELAQQEAEQIAAQERAEWLAAGEECRRLDKELRNARARIAAVADGAPKRWPREIAMGVQVLGSYQNYFLPMADATYTLLSFAGKRERLRFLRAGREEREAMLREVLARGGVYNDRGFFQEIVR